MSQGGQEAGLTNGKCVLFLIFSIIPRNNLNETLGSQTNSREHCCGLHCLFSFPNVSVTNSSSVRSHPSFIPPHPPSPSTPLWNSEVWKSMTQLRTELVLNSSDQSPGCSLEALLEIIESCHQEKLLKEEFRVQHSDMGCTANQSVGSVGQSMEHIVSDQSAALSFHQGAQEVVDHFCIHWPQKEGRKQRKLAQKVAIQAGEHLCMCVGRAHKRLRSNLMLGGANK